MLAQRQAIDDRDRRAGGQLGDDLVRTGPDDDRVDEPLEISCDVPDALARAEDDVVRQVDRVPPQLRHPSLECHAGPQAGPLKKHRQRPPDERRIDVPMVRDELGLQLRRAVEDRDDLGGAEISRAKKIPAPQGCRLRCDAHHATLAAPMTAARRGATAWCTAEPCAPASGRTSCAPSSAGRESGGRPGAGRGGLALALVPSYRSTG